MKEKPKPRCIVIVQYPTAKDPTMKTCEKEAGKGGKVCADHAEGFVRNKIIYRKAGIIPPDER
jgi:hypothetical protein